MTGDHGPGRRPQPERGRTRTRRGPIVFQIGAAHAGRLDLQHHLSGTRRRILEVLQPQLPIAKKNDALHLHLHLAARFAAGLCHIKLVADRASRLSGWPNT